MILHLRSSTFDISIFERLSKKKCSIHISVSLLLLERGDYLIVGIHGDSVVNKRRGGNLPLMNLHERVLSVLGCKYMNDVLIDALLRLLLT